MVFVVSNCCKRAVFEWPSIVVTMQQLLLCLMVFYRPKIDSVKCDGFCKIEKNGQA